MKPGLVTVLPLLCFVGCGSTKPLNLIDCSQVPAGYDVYRCISTKVSLTDGVEFSVFQDSSGREMCFLYSSETKGAEEIEGWVPLKAGKYYLLSVLTIRSQHDKFLIDVEGLPPRIQIHMSPELRGLYVKKIVCGEVSS